jgi:hypothetical protein
MNNHEEKQIGSNLTGAAIPAKPGHQRDIQIDQYDEGKDQVENTDALLGDVDPIKRNDESQENSNADEQSHSETTP